MRAVTRNGVQFWNGAALPTGFVFALSCVLALMLSAPRVNSAVSVPDGAMGRREVAEQAAVEVKLLAKEYLPPIYKLGHIANGLISFGSSEIPATSS